MVVKIIAAKKNKPPPHSSVSSTPKKSIQWKAAPARKKKKPRDLKLCGIVDVVACCIVSQRVTRLVKLIHTPKTRTTAGIIAT